MLSLGWGFNWPIMKLGLQEMPLLTFRALSISAGALGLFIIARMTDQPLLPSRRHWKRLILTSLLNVTAWNLLIAYGLLLLPAGRSVILAYTMPLWVALLSVPLLGERFTRRRALGVALGMAGMLLLLSNELAGLQAAPIGSVMILSAAFTWALGTILMKRFPIRLPTASFTAWQLLLGGTPIIVAAAVIDAGKLGPLSSTGIFALLYNMFIAFVLCHWAWFKIVARASAAVSSLGTLMIPVVGVVSSMLILGERPTWQEYAAMALVIGALATVIVPRAPASKPS